VILFSGAGTRAVRHNRRPCFLGTAQYGEKHAAGTCLSALRVAVPEKLARTVGANGATRVSEAGGGIWGFNR